MCMEKLADKQGDKKKREEQAEEIIANYERAGDLALYYLQVWKNVFCFRMS